MPHSLQMWNEVGENIRTFPTVGHNYSSHVHYRICLPNNKNVAFADSVIFFIMIVTTVQ